VLRVGRAGEDERRGKRGRTGCAGFEQGTAIHGGFLLVGAGTWTPDVPESAMSGVRSGPIVANANRGRRRRFTSGPHREAPGDRGATATRGSADGRQVANRQYAVDRGDRLDRRSRHRAVDIDERI